MKAFWDDRYNKEVYAYGIEPNQFFKQQLDSFSSKGKLLLPAEGEGRNAIYAAKQGWDVFAFDISEAGKEKAMKLATSNGVSIHYEVGPLADLHLAAQSYDVIALIYAHFPPPVKAIYFPQFVELLNPGGHIILEGFSTTHLPYRSKNPAVGGPNVPEMLFSVEEMEKVFGSLEIILLEDVEVLLEEGEFHNGTGKVIRFLGKKG